MNKHCRKYKQTGVWGGRGWGGAAWGGERNLHRSNEQKETGFLHGRVGLKNKILYCPREALSHLPLVGVFAPNASQLLLMTVN